MEQKYYPDDIEFLISTQNRTSIDFLKSIFKHSDFTLHNVLIINQTVPDKELVSSLPNIRVLNSYEKGLSKSRNLALKNAIGKILVIADDDVEYFKNTQNIICNAYNIYKDADVIHFQAQKNERQLLKKYAKKNKNPSSIFVILNCSSIEITFKKEVLEENNFTFDENFGINATFDFGEEALFLKALRMYGKRIVFVKETIVQHESTTTTSKNSLEKNYFGYGAFNKQMFGKKHFLWLLIKIFFDLKQRKIKPNQLFQILDYAKQGRKKLDDLKRRKE